MTAILAPDRLPAPLLGHDLTDHPDHVDVTLEMRRLVEALGLGLATRAAQVDEVDAIGELARHGRQIVVGAHAIGAGAEREAVGGTLDLGQEPAAVLGRADDARQAEQRARRVVRVDAETHARLLGCRRHGANESRIVRPQPLAAEVAVALERRAQHVEAIALLGARQASDDVAGELRSLGFVHRRVDAACVLDLLGAVVALGVAPREDEEIEGGEGVGIEPERPRTVGQLIGEVGAGPVEHRHEVVADGADARAREVADRLGVGVEMRPPGARSGS